MLIEESLTKTSSAQTERTYKHKEQNLTQNLNNTH